MKHFLLLASVTLFCLLPGCNRHEQFLQQFEKISSDMDPSELYRLRLAASVMIMKDAGDLEERVQMVRSLVDMHAFAEARYGIGHLLEQVNQSIPELFYLEAVCFRNELHFEPALESIEKALAIDPSNQRYVDERVIITEENADWELIGTLDRRISNEPESPGPVFSRAEQFLNMGMYEAAQYDADRMLQLDSSAVGAYLIKGYAYLRNGAYQEAETAFQVLLERTPGPEKRAGYQKYYEASGRLYQYAVEIESRPGEFTPYINMARELSNLEEFNSALLIIGDGLEKNRNHPNLLHARLLVQLQQGDLAGGRETAMYMESLGIGVDPQLKQMFR